MRGLPVRRAALTALCATLLLGIAAPSALAADGEATRERTHAVPSASLSGADALLARARSLDDIKPALAPVTDLLDTSLRTASQGRSADRAKRLGAAAEDALTRVAESTGPATTPSHGDRVGPGARAADITDDLLATVEKQLGALLEAATSGDVDQILPAATSLVTGLSDLVTSLVDGLSLPTLPTLTDVTDVTDLTGLGDLPEVSTLPAETPALPVTTPALPVTTPALPVTTPALPVTPSTLPAQASPLTPKAQAPDA
ncbi:hypothetical protein BM536_012490 [Streptomyces phaeoluteigriseus]|uniref:Secreted protein n=1 Tax=Streptomyces phaeoluteigriseus TaxID=114686 RepID=A0A1V6MSS1_9ACTN|nr:hypothetical protein [Streptomyces phaeoluteigriseus]OQD55405.1 hypothetical protein BM536_012490 [Streptomyces phaeoluteigriseus]